MQNYKYADAVLCKDCNYYVPLGQQHNCKQKADKTVYGINTVSKDVKFCGLCEKWVPADKLHPCTPAFEYKGPNYYSSGTHEQQITNASALTTTVKYCEACSAVVPVDSYASHMKMHWTTLLAKTTTDPYQQQKVNNLEQQVISLQGQVSFLTAELKKLQEEVANVDKPIINALF